MPLSVEEGTVKAANGSALSLVIRGAKGEENPPPNPADAAVVGDP
jgi:hypothetical protein